jgi:hypothetical protein
MKCGLPEKPREEKNFRTLKEGSRSISISGTPHRPLKGSSALSVHPVFALTAVPGVSPAPATEQKQHQENNQYGFHVVTSLVKEAGRAFITVVSLLHYTTS